MTRSGPPLASCSCCYHRSSEKNITQSAPTNKYKSSKKFLNHATVVAFIVISLSNLQQPCEAAFYGKSLGKLTEYHHGVSGEVFAVDARTLYIKDLTYDGEGPAAYFYAGNSKAPIINGFRVPDEKGRTGLLRKYRKEDITLTLPEGKTLNNIRWFSLWCDDFSVNFGDVKIPRGFDYPRPQKLGTLSGIHGVSSEPIVVVDAQTLLIPGFSYDGEAPDAKFWAGPGPSPTPQGIKIPDENGKTAPLRRYVQKTIVLTLPGDLTVHQLGHFGVWCEAFTVDFGHVKIPQNLNVPPSLKMLGVSPQSKLNCEILQDDLAFEVRWAVAGDSVVFQLVAKLDDGQYMSFGLSPDPKKTVMIGGDVVVAWVDKQTLQGYAVDYFLDAKSQCSGRRGSCPDVRIQDDTNSVSLLNAAMVNGYSIVTYQRPLKASDELDVSITTNGSQAIIWAIGPLNERKEVSFHSEYLKKDQFIEFGRPPRWNCPMPDTLDNEKVLVNKDKDSTSQQTAITTRRPSHGPATPAPASKKGAWVIPPIQCDEPEDGVFYAQMGPTGGKHGYSAITGHVGWGVSWYINGLLIPEINVVRGKKYSFIVEAGSDSEVPARYHPFYITDDSVGGYQHKTPEEKANVTIYAGVERIRGKTKLTGVGRFCYWTPDQNVDSDDFSSFGAYQRTLTLKCDAGEDPGVVHWTPDKNTPDTVYYQCYTHRYLGWKINVHDDCDISPEGAASEVREVYAKAPEALDEFSDLDSESSGSVRVSSKLNTIESKMSQTDVQQQTPKPTVPTDPARNTGFKPESVVVEGGFKPIIRITDVTKFAEDRRFEGGSSEMDDDIPENGKEYRPLDSFEPMFVPSPPDRNQSKKRNQMMRKKAQLLINKQRLNDESTDMETAADRLEAYYLPAVPAGAVENPAGLKPTRLNKEVNEGRLVTADGTQVQDQNLARSIPRVSSERLRSRISSDALSRTPQFGQFRGELPPPIPGDLRTDNIPQLQQQNFRKISTSSSGSLYKDRNNNHAGSTRLTVVQRSRRSAHHVPGHDDSSDGMNNTESVVTHAQVTPTINQKNNHDIPGEHDHHDHSQHDHSKHIHHNENGDTESPSAGELIMANIKWIILTVILYFVI
ncbi:protein Skeletor, isoforms B/C isoform X1 [Athalia rosae]|uniref:protein Skeletor, isoforms B/C isoform X1 n=1 Tax=Athalia rosae TaxID=37344 RepID=UPI002033F153|nr:protein Skeletor, isoforms B/C isoform X1 [Athalia rosae]